MISIRHSQIRLRVAATLCALLCLAFASASAQPVRGDAEAAQTSTREGRLRVFDEVWEQVRARYYDPALRGVDWKRLGQTLRPLAEDAAGERELYAVLRRLLGHLRDPHTRAHAPGEGADWRERRFISVGITAREMSGEVIVTSVARDSDAARAGVRAGDAILRIDGAPVESFISRRDENHHAENSTNSRSSSITHIFEGPRGSTMTAVFRRASETSELTLKLRREMKVMKPEFRARKLKGGIGLVHFNLFTPESARRFARVLNGELKSVRSLVIDLRDNGGGETEAMTDIASFFLPSGTSLGRFADRDGRVRVESRTRSVLISSADELPRFNGPLTLLTSARTASAAEIFAAALGEHKRARIIGETSCGCVLGIRRRHALPDGGALDISEMDYHTARGTRLEGAGLAPDEAISVTRDDIRRGRDPALTRAIESLDETKALPSFDLSNDGRAFGL